VFISAFTAGERLMELEEIPQEESDERHPIAAPVGIRLEHVHFSYTPESRCILRDFTHTFPPGSITAIVGETGSGKTTLIRLLLALAQPTSGAVHMFADPSGKAVGQGDASCSSEQSVPASPSTRCNFAYVPQGNTLLSGTIRENLLWGNPDASQEELHQALAAADASFVYRLPDGLDTRIGEKAYGLSEGQAQRIAIARALLRHVPILVLDEATSALDEESEKRILSALASPNRSYAPLCLIVTHRPSMLPYFDQVLHIQHDGTITIT
jgi:ABC-type multidrug transport system fused ATPase/permease subunit